MADRIQIRRDLHSVWASVNPVLADGEFAWSRDTKVLKIGDGTTVWADLAGFESVVGADGESAYEVAVSNGFVGTEEDWLASLVGPQGPQGEIGPAGPQGPAGSDATVTAGDGITVTSGTVAVDSSVIRSSDSRLTDAREWTATTIDKAEAEAGTATTRRAFTAQRVWQAIVAWWNGVTSAFGRTFVANADAAAARTQLGLGTAALGTVTTVTNDTTGGLISRIGDWGLGGSAVAWADSDYNNIPFVSGIFAGPGSGATNVPPYGGQFYPMLRIRRSSSNRILDISGGSVSLAGVLYPRIGIRIVDVAGNHPWQKLCVSGFEDNAGNALFGTTTDTGEKLQAVGGFRADSIKEGSDLLVEKYADGLRHFVLPPVAGDYIDQSVDAVTLTTATQTVNRLRMVPFIPSRTITVDQLGVVVSTAVAGGFVVVGIYSSKANNTPNALLAQTAELPTGTATGVYSTVSQTLVAGQLYWLAWNTNASGLGLRACTAGSGRAVGAFSSGTITTKLTMLEQTSTYNATMPATWGTYSSSQRIGGHQASIRMRIA